MTKNSQRLALSQYEGWLDVMIDDNGRGPRGFPPGSNIGLFGYPDGPHPKTLPSYDTMEDLNRVINGLDYNHRLGWLCKMFELCGSLENIVKAPVDTWAEALLKSLNLWKY